MNKRPDITDATRQRFIDAFSKIYEDKPVEKITVTEIAKCAGHNRVTFYQYFHDAYDVLEYMENDLISYVAEKIHQNIQCQNVLENFADRFVKIIDEKNSLAQILLTGKNAERTIDKMKKQMLDLFSDEFGIENMDIRLRYLLEFYCSGVAYTLALWMKSEQNLPREELADIIRHHFKNSIILQMGNCTLVNNVTP